jgi:hypothetical protein
MANVLLAASQAHEYLDSRCSCGRELKRVSWQVQNRLAAGPGMTQGSRCVQCGVISIWSEGFTASSSFDDRDSTAKDDGCRVRVYKAVITAARLQYLCRRDGSQRSLLLPRAQFCVKSVG